MGVVRYSRPVSVDTASTTVPLQQAILAWPGTEETCPKCHGKRITCPTCAGAGTVRTPLPSKAVPTRG